MLEEEGISVSSGALPFVEDDVFVQNLNEEIDSIFDSYHEFDLHDDACWFDEDMQRANLERMLDSVTRLNTRFCEISDGSYIVEDLETPFLANL